MPEQLPHDKAAALNVTIFASTSLAIMTMDFIWLIRDEIKYIWPALRSSWKARIHVVMRYIGLLSQIFNVYFSVRMYRGTYTSPEGCKLWFSFQAVVVQLHLFAVEGLLMHRVYVLFLKNRGVMMILGALMLVQMASMGVSAKLVFPDNRITVSCMVVKSNPGVALFSTTTLTTNLVILVMTFWRYLRLPQKLVKEGIARIVVRDVALTLSAILATMVFLTLLSLKVINPHTSNNTTYYWLVCILWVSMGRIIINHERYQKQIDEKEDSDTWRGTVQLTSQIEMGESTLTLGSTLCESSDTRDPGMGQSDQSLSMPMSKESQIPSSSVSGSGLKKPSNGYLDVDEHQRSRRPSTATLGPSVDVHTTKEGLDAVSDDCHTSDDTRREDQSRLDSEEVSQPQTTGTNGDDETPQASRCAEDGEMGEDQRSQRTSTPEPSVEVRESEDGPDPVSGDCTSDDTRKEDSGLADVAEVSEPIDTNCDDKVSQTRNSAEGRERDGAISSPQTP